MKWVAIGYQSGEKYAQGEKAECVRAINKRYPYRYRSDGKRCYKRASVLPEPILIVSHVEYLRIRRHKRYKARIKQAV